MCTSESEAAEISLSNNISNTLNTRKRSLGSRVSCYSDVLEHLMDGEEDDVDQFGEEIGTEDSDEDFEVTKKKKVNVGRKRKNTSISISSITSNNVSKSARKVSVNSFPSPSISSPPMVILKSDPCDIKIDVFIDKKEQADVVAIKQLTSDINDNNSVERPVVIATPEQINSRSFDQEQEEFMTPSAIPMEDKANMNYDKMDQIKSNVLLRSLQFIPTVSPSLSTLIEDDQLVPVPSPFSIQKHSNASQIQQIPISGHQYQANVGTRPLARRGRAMIMRPTLPTRSFVIGRQATPCAMPPIRSGTTMMRYGASRSLVRSLRPDGPACNAGGLNCRPRVPGQRLPSCRSNLPSVRTAHPYRQRSHSTPQYSSQFAHPLVEIDVSPPRPDQVFAPSPPSSVVSKLTSLGVSVAREKLPPTKHGWVLPPGISVTKANSTTAVDLSLFLPSLGQALIQLGKVDGRKKLVRYHLTDAQIRALEDLGIQNDGAHQVN